MKAITLAVLVAGFVAPAMAQQKADDHSAHHAAAADMTTGEVRKVDKDARKLTIRHGEIKNLDMPAMTTVFQVENDALLDKVKAGDKIRFVALKSDSGYVATDIQVTR